MSKLKNLFSRKFLVSIAALGAAFTGKEIDPLRIAIIAGIAAVYVIAEAFLDHKGMPTPASLADDVSRAVDLDQRYDLTERGREVLDKLGVAPNPSKSGPTKEGAA